MTLSKFLTYWSLTFAILAIWIFSIAVAAADVKDEILAKARTQFRKTQLKPIDPLATQSVAQTLTSGAMDENQQWVFHLVSEIAIPLKLNVKIMVLQDSMDHYLVHFVQGPRLVSYRIDKTWVKDAMAGKADQRERIHTAVEQYLRQEFLGQKPVPKGAPAPAAPPKPAAAAAASGEPAKPPGGAAGA